mmetsp:Transcript_12006/g.34582  ORF Transcript_12006/g.34582 Transcript_12006/m.34582 type:complete len:370 (+) Transcript_12006:1-1110(+)
MGLSTLLRLAGFISHREQGKAFLAGIVEHDLGTRASLAAVVLAMYHLDLEPDVPRAGELLVKSLSRTPENVFLHWAGSVLAWRNVCHAQALDMTNKALLCCGRELSQEALFLRYEIGVLHFIVFDAPAAYPHLRFVSDVTRAERVLFPYRVILSAQLAATCFCTDREAEGTALCLEAERVQEWGGFLKIEGDCAKVMRVFGEHRSLCRQLLAYEVVYLLRQFAKIPQAILYESRRRLRETAEPFIEQVRRSAHVAGGAPIVACSEAEVLVESVSAQVIDAVLCFYLADVESAMEFVPSLSRSCLLLPGWASYLSAHGLYWCGRVYALASQTKSAVDCLRQAKSYKKYPFHIGEKISKVLVDLEKQEVGR